MSESNIDPEDASKKTDRPAEKSGAYSTLYSMGTNVLVVFMNVGTGIITARALQPAGRGEFASVTLWPGLLGFILLLGLPSALVYQIRTNQQSTRQLYTASLVLALILGVVSCLAGILIIPRFLVHYSIGAIHTSQLLALVGIPTIACSLAVSAIQASGDLVGANNRRLLTTFATLMGLVVLLLAHKLNPIIAAWFYIVPGVLVNVAILYRTTRKIGLDFAGIFDYSRSLLSFGIRTYGSDLIALISTQIDSALVVGFLSPADMGLYSVALSLSRFTNILQTGIWFVVLPKLAGLSPEAIAELSGRAIRLNLVLTSCVALTLTVLAPIGIKAFYGKDFEPAIPAFRFLLIEACISGTTAIIAQSFLALGRPGIMTVVQSLGLATAVPLLLWLIPRYGIAGAGCAILSSTCVRFVAVMACYPMVLKMPLPSLVWKKRDSAAVITAMSRLFRSRPQHAN
jgi:O-antigen/teichoic acid export membrane protein